MAKVEIGCARYKDLKMVIGEDMDLNEETLNRIRFDAQELYYDCGKRNPSGCSPDCPLSRVGQADLRNLKQIIEKLRGNDSAGNNQLNSKNNIC